MFVLIIVFLTAKMLYWNVGFNYYIFNGLNVKLKCLF